ncbi:MAG: ATP-dependent 6-phosphofructokinase [Bacteroidales bacterium]|nr:ATP-dependent 6-phosphofructokinase [Bacteroidales bacterium]MBN2819653.1 ATP-dependent 6-phosphofructokinase [Bacteroidales bacterium]
MYNSEDFLVTRLGNNTVPSPLHLSKETGDGVFNYINDEDRVLYKPTLEYFNLCENENIKPVSFEKAGPKEKIYFDPNKTKVAIVTCGGLCPGLNNVIRGLVMQLYNRYGVKRIIGIKYGYEGFIPEFNHDIIDLTPEMVEDIHMFGGSFLGSSRGHQDPAMIVDALERMNINILFTIGGDGTLRGAQAITEEVRKRKLKIAVAGIPKTIDNDINLIEKSFGFETAFTIASDILRGAHNEAKGAYNGIALVKLMGRESGFIAANAALAVQEVNFLIVPEMEFELHGPKGFLHILRKRLERKNHALIVVAEGAGQDLFLDKEIKNDASGNIKFKDIGIYLKEKIKEEFDNRKIRYSIKYIDPSYIIRSAAANANDSLFCNLLAQNAVHGAMAGRTGFIAGYWNSQFTLLPIPMAVKEKKKISIEGELWSNVLETTGQPKSFKNSSDTEILRLK